MINRNLAVCSVVKYERSLCRHCSILADSLNKSFFCSKIVSIMLKDIVLFKHLLLELSFLLNYLELLLFQLLVLLRCQI